MTDRDDDQITPEKLEEWKKKYEAGDESAKELFRQVSNISLLVAYDLVDKIRWWEKETLKLDEDQVAERLPHMTEVLDQLKVAYVTFSEIDF
jgi:hypothetical protein